MTTPSYGRRNASGVFTDTVPANSAEQAMLLKQDEIIKKINALVADLAVATNITDVNAAAAAIVAIIPVKLIP